MNKGIEIHHVFDPLETIPSFRIANGFDVEHFLDAAGPPGHDGNAVG
jgi:hypothetical protein